MINILLVDDNNNKVANIIKVIREISENIEIDTVIDYNSALKYLTSFRYDLLILDMNLPLIEGTIPSIEVGKNLLNEINRKSIVQSPYYIITITQYIDSCSDISDIWRTLNYLPEQNTWKAPLINLIKHINKTSIAHLKSNVHLPTIIFEGKTDEIIFREAIKLFKPEIIDKVSLKSDKNAGATWVARQIIVWAHSLKKNTDVYVKCIGLLDNDLAGNRAKEEVDRVIKLDSAERNTFKLFRLSPSYAKHIIPIKQKGLDLPITLEEMFQPDIWYLAKEQDWLEARTNPDSLLINPEKWNKYEVSLKDYLTTIGLSKEESMYLNCFKSECKEKLIDYLFSLSEADRKKHFKPFEAIVEDMYKYLFS